MIPKLLAKLITFVLGFLYPSYTSHKAIKSGNEMAKQWASYWIVRCILTCTEEVMENWTFLCNWIPLYYDVKLLFAIFMITPISHGGQHVIGSTVVYKKIV